MSEVMRIGSAIASQLASPDGRLSRKELFGLLAQLAGSQFGVVERGQLVAMGFTPAQIHHLIELVI